MARKKQSKVKPLFTTSDLLAIPRTEGVKVDITQKGVAAVRANYTILRDIAQKRLKRAQKRGYFTDREHFVKLKDITSAADLAVEYANVSKFLLDKESTAEGRARREEKAVKTFQTAGFDFVSKENILDFGKFMGVMIGIYSQETPEGARQLNLDSDAIAEYFDAIRESTRGRIKELYKYRDRLGKDKNGRGDRDLPDEIKKSRDLVADAFRKWLTRRG